MMVIADSGSTKTHWKVVCDNNQSVSFTTRGLNPYFTSDKDLSNALTDSFPKYIAPDDVLKVFFYGSGCAIDARAQEVQSRLVHFFVNATVEVYSDILAAARSLFGVSQGLVIILGSGTNVGYYDGNSVTHITPSLGYAIGDEGSGAYLGKKLLRHWQYKELPDDLAVEFGKKYHYSISELLMKIYREPFPNRFLAEFVPFLAEHSSHAFVEDLINKSFKKLVERHLLKYPMFKTTPIGVVGSVGSVFKKQLQATIESKGGRLTKVIAYPLDELVDFHSKNI